MRVAICGYPPLAVQVVEAFRNSGMECRHFVRDFVSGRGEGNFNLPSTPPLALVNFFEFRRLVESDALDALIIAEDGGAPLTKNVVKTCKLYEIPVGVLNLENPQGATIHWLDSDKAFIPYIEINLIDSCNLNCRGCTHFANLFSDADFYALEDFKRDIRQVAEAADVFKIRLMGGEPLKLKNLDQYVKIARKFLPKTTLKIVTNGLLIPSAPQSLFDALRENNFGVDVSLYPPTVKILDKIQARLAENRVACSCVTFGGKPAEYFNVFMTLRGGHNPANSRAICGSDGCRFLRDGRLYKCPVDALSSRFAERFGLKDFPAAAGVDVYAKNFPALLEQLDGNIELCAWCSERNRLIPWSPENKPAVTDWLAEPSEAERLQN